MKFETDEIVLFYDDGMFPSLHSKQCRVVGVTRSLGVKMLEVEFIISAGRKFRHSFPIKQFKKIKDKSKIDIHFS